VTDSPPGALPLPVVPGLTDLAAFARGGYATVFRAIQQSVGREVAVKVENRTLDNERDQARFLREARAAGRMSSHPHVVDLFDVGVTTDRHPYLIMELCDGSYAERMRTSPLGAAEAREVGVKIADALADAHQLGVLHRDVKPANILYSRFGEPALADFGLAIIAEARDHSVTFEVLTPAYAPPEMFRHSPPAPAVDVYALCATLYAIMQGKPPRWRDDLNPSLLTLMEMFGEPIPELPGIPSALTDVLRAGMANNPADRPSAEELRDLLAAVPLGPPAAGTVPPVSGAPVSGSPVSGSPVSGAPTSGGGTGSHYSSRAHAPPSAPGAPSAAAPPPPAMPFHDATPTVPTTPRRPGLGWFLGGVAVLALTVAAGVGAWAVARLPGPRPSPTGLAPSSAQPSGRPSVGGGGALPGCLVPLPGHARCPAELECFGPVLQRGSRARADRVPCAGRHTWESYAVGDLPAEATATDYPVVKADPTVRQVCGEDTFRLVTRMSPNGWKLEVLPPTKEAAAAGDRTFRCLAGRGANELSGPTLAD
jgi:serine/threonine protein kinase